MDPRRRRLDAQRPKGANMKFDSFPLSGRIVVREMTEQDNNAGDEFNTASVGGAQ